MGNCVDWVSRKQRNVATSPQHAETIATDVGVRKVVWFRKLLADIRAPEVGASRVFVDNAGLISSTVNTPKHETNKHLNVKLWYKNELHQKKMIQIQHMETARLTADALTKPLAKPAFRAHMRVMLGVDYVPERDGVRMANLSDESVMEEENLSAESVKEEEDLSDELMMVGAGTVTGEKEL